MTKTSIIRTLAVGMAVFAAGCGSDTSGPSQQQITASLNGAAEVPSVSTTATGSTTFTVNGGTVGYMISAQNIAAVTMAHIHVGVTGQNGPVAVTLFGGPTTGTVNGTLVQGSFTAADIAAGVGLSMDQLVELMRSGGAYINVHTTAHPGGEIRGQTRTR